MRVLHLIAALLFVAAGIAVGALNPQPVVLDLGIVHLRTTLGIAVLVTLLIGAILGGLAIALSVVVPLQQRLRAQRRASAASDPPATAP
jgi:hypothetical protein